MKIGLVAAIGLLAVSAQSANATPIMNANTGLASPAVVVDFGVGGVSNLVVTDQFASQGVTFSSFAPGGGLYWGPESGIPPQMDGNVGNFTNDDFVAYSPFAMNFTVDQTAVAFLMAALDISWTFQALLDGSVVESFSTTVGSSVARYFGFTGVTFDQILLIGPVSGGDFANIALIDNIQLSVAPPPPPPPSQGGDVGVPAPGSLALIGLGLVGFAGLRRRAA